MNTHKFRLFLTDFLDTLKYDFLGQKKPKFNFDVLREIPREIQFKTYTDDKGLILKAKNLDGFVISAPNKEIALEVIRDGLSVYYDVPRYFARRMSKNAVLKDSKGKIIAQDKFRADDTLNYIRA